MRLYINGNPVSVGQRIRTVYAGWNRKGTAFTFLSIHQYRNKWMVEVEDTRVNKRTHGCYRIRDFSPAVFGAEIKKEEKS